MYFPKGRHLDSIICSRAIHSDSGSVAGVRHLSGNAFGNVKNVLEEVDGSGNVLARYVQNLGIDEPLAETRGSTTSYYDADGLGSVSSLSNSSGALVNTYSYDSFGNLTASSGSVTNPYRYTGREFDSETGAYYYRARYYQSDVGRFLNEPTWAGRLRIQSVNRRSC